MTTQTDRNAGQTTTQVHPLVYRSMLGLAILMTLATWGFYAPDHYLGLILGVVSAFVFLVLTLATMLSRMSWKYKSKASRQDGASAGGWLNRQFQTWQYSIKGSEAATNMLLPIAAVALGMVILTVEFSFVSA
jgi:hypothetical protein